MLPEVLGTDSNCDHLDQSLMPTACLNQPVQSPRTANLGDGIVLTLAYIYGANGGCRVVWADLFVPNYSGSGVCYAKVQRNSDGDADRAGVPVGGHVAVTKTLYDYGVTSYAWATCTYGGHTYSGSTGNW